MDKTLNTYIVLLRGVMPTGKNRIPKMEYLREILKNAGFLSVQTYIQSGNIVLQSIFQPFEIAEKVQNLIKEYIGAELTVIVKTVDEIKHVLKENPFVENYDINRVFFTLFNSELDITLAQDIKNKDFEEEKFDFIKEGMYMYIPQNASRSKLNNNFLEKKLKIKATTRNFNTLTKLVNMAEDISKES